jgi:hypothetical protein
MPQNLSSQPYLKAKRVKIYEVNSNILKALKHTDLHLQVSINFSTTKLYKKV